MNFRLLFFALVVAACSFTSAQESTVHEAQLKVFGNCGMCKTRIEKAVALKEVKYAKWNKTTKMLRIAFQTPGMTLDSLEQRIAAVGHDTEKFKAPDEVYASLPACCLYRSGDSTH
jgi:hypothetical protein